jgi:hypothetical protein
MVPITSPAPHTLVGRVYDFQLGEYYTFPRASVDLFASAAFASPITGLVTDDQGNYTVDLPAGAPNILYAHVRGGIIAEEYLHAIRPTSTFAPDILALNIAAARVSFVDDAASLVRVTRDAADGFVYVVVSDCDGNPIEHVEVVLSVQRRVRTFVAHASTVYGTAGATPVPVLVVAQADTADNGASGIFNIAPDAEYYLQAWGFRTQDDVARGEQGLALVMEYPVSIARATAYGITNRTNVVPDPR